MAAHSACVLTIGDELLNGDVINTNAAMLGHAMRGIGIPCKTMITVADRHSDILNALAMLWKDHDLIVITGGLGPTRDDVTKKVLLDFFNDRLVRDEAVLAHVIAYFKRRGREISEVNEQQADVPSQAAVMENELGTAPGLFFDVDGRLLAAMPGVPFELEHITTKRLIPMLEHRWEKSGRRINQHYFRTTGIGESNLSEHILHGLENKLPESTDIAFLPHPKGVDIRVTEINGHPGASFGTFVDWIRRKSGDFIFSEDYSESLAQRVVRMLTAEKRSLACAESCTGGTIADAITDIPGSSACFKGGIVAYDNNVKTGVLGVSKATIEQHGAVSAPVALEMANRAGALFKADYGISTTGIAGPSGGSEDKPVGTVWIGFWARTGEHFACRYVFTSERLINKERSCAVVMDILRRHMQNIPAFPGKPEVISS